MAKASPVQPVIYASALDEVRSTVRDDDRIWLPDRQLMSDGQLEELRGQMSAHLQLLAQMICCGLLEDTGSCGLAIADASFRMLNDVLLRYRLFHDLRQCQQTLAASTGQRGEFTAAQSASSSLAAAAQSASSSQPSSQASCRQPNSDELAATLSPSSGLLLLAEQNYRQSTNDVRRDVSAQRDDSAGHVDIVDPDEDVHVDIVDAVDDPAALLRPAPATFDIASQQQQQQQQQQQLSAGKNESTFLTGQPAGNASSSVVQASAPAASISTCGRLIIVPCLSVVNSQQTVWAFYDEAGSIILPEQQYAHMLPPFPSLPPLSGHAAVDFVSQFDVRGMFCVYNKLAPFLWAKPIVRISPALSSCLQLSFVSFFDVRYLVAEYPSLYKGKSSVLFTPSEDVLLLNAALASGFDFRLMKSYLSNKNVEQIRCHWSNMCKPAARDNPIRRHREEVERTPMTKAEIEKFCHVVRNHGFHWTKLSQIFAPRGVKNMKENWRRQVGTEPKKDALIKALTKPTDQQQQQQT